MKNSTKNDYIIASNSVLDILLVIFVVLKVTGNITWSWWWVLSPIWIPIAALFAVFTVVLLISVIRRAVTRNE